MEDIDLLEDEVVEQEFVINEKGERLAYVSPAAIASIEQGLADFANGRVRTHEEVMRRARSRYL
ncbi:MAG: hypothetical protein LBO69_05600 [Ignavibacteria bacterium]|jgi:hypothetical protein|nr:hypothetical protein [Ignavibacteria bacterium]